MDEPSPPEPRKGPGVLENSLINVVGLGAAQGLSALSGLITARALGPAAVGIIAVSFSLVEFGRSLSNFTHTPSIIEYHRSKDAPGVFGTSLALKLVGSLFFLIAISLAAPFLSETFRVPSWTLMLAAVGFLCGTAYEIGAARFEADNRMMQRNLLLAMGPIANLALVSLFAVTGTLTIFTSILTNLIAVSVMSLAFFLDEPRLYKMRFDAAIAKYLGGYGSRIVVSSLVASGLLWTDTLMVSALLGNREAGIYSVVFQITYVIVTASVAVGISLIPALAELAGRGAETRIGFQRGTLIALGLSTVIATIFLISGYFILALYGPEFQDGYWVMAILLIFGIAAATAVPATSLLTVHGHANLLTLVSAAQLAVNVPLNYVMTTSFGLIGSAIATTIVFTCGTLILWIIIYKRYRALPVSRGVIDEAWDELRRLAGRVFS